MNKNLAFPVLIGDIGGTNSRFAIVRDMHSDIEHLPAVVTDAYPSLKSAVEDAVFAKTSIIPARMILAIAAPVFGREYQLTNAKWNINPEETVSNLGLNSAEFMNDFSAQALGVLTIKHELMHKIGAGRVEKHGTRVVLGPGTSFGISTIIHAAGRWTIIPSEGACMDNGLGTGQNSERELQIQQYLNRRCGRQVIENTSSGSGLENLYQAICRANDTGRQSLSAAKISAAAVLGQDKAACEAVKLFSVLLGRIAGNLALNVNATGGIYVTGDMARKMLPQIEANGFRAEFENKAPHENLVRNMPTFFINRQHAALEGLANYVRTQDSFDLTHASAFYYA